MRLPCVPFRSALVAVACALGAASSATASVVYSFQGTTSQSFFDAGRQQVTDLTYLVKWSATFTNFVTVGGSFSPSAPFDSCSITPTGFTTFPVTKTCGPTVTLSHETSRDLVGFTYNFPTYGLGGVDQFNFTSGDFTTAGIYNVLVTGFATNGTLTVTDLSAVPPVPLPAGLPLLAAAVATLGIARRRKAARNAGS